MQVYVDMTDSHLGATQVPQQEVVTAGVTPLASDHPGRGLASVAGRQRTGRADVGDKLVV